MCLLSSRNDVVRSMGAKRIAVADHGNQFSRADRTFDGPAFDGRGIGMCGHSLMELLDQFGTGHFEDRELLDDLVVPPQMMPDDCSSA